MSPFRERYLRYDELTRTVRAWAEAHPSFVRLETLGATPEGRVTLSEMKLIVTRNGQREERSLASEAERSAVLEEQFGIRL